MVGAGCPTKVSTQQRSAHSAWAPARPSPASSVISQKPALTNVPSSEPATREICHPAKTLPSSLKKKKSHVQKLHFRSGQMGSIGGIYYTELNQLLLTASEFIR